MYAELCQLHIDLNARCDAWKDVAEALAGAVEGHFSAKGVDSNSYERMRKALAMFKRLRAEP